MSVDRSGQARSVGEQHADNQRHATQRGVELGEPYRDDGVSASRYATKTRDGFKRLLADLWAGQFAATELWLWEASRGSRRVSEWCALVEACEDAHVTIYVTTHGRCYDPANHRDRKSLLEDAVDAEYESAKTSARVRRHLTAAAEAGRPHGKLPYGYRREFDGRGRFVRQVLDDEQAEVLREVADRFLGGVSLWALALDLTARGVPTPSGAGRWWPTNLRRLLMSPVYAGQRSHNGTVVHDGAWPAVFTPRVRRQLQAKIGDPGRSSRRDPSARHLLSHLARCGVCDDGGRVQTVKKGPRRSYFCADCYGFARSQAPVDAYVEGLVLARLREPNVIAALSEPDGAAQEAAEHAAALRERLSALIEQAADGRITAETVARIEAKLQPQIQAAEAQARAYIPAAVAELLDPAELDTRWNALPVVLKREVIRLLMTVTIKPTGRGRRFFDPASVDITWH